MSAEARFGAGQRVLLACAGDVPALRPALEACRAAWPQAHLALLVPAAERDAAPDWAAEVLAPTTFWTPELPERLRAGRFDAAVILTAPGDSPHGLGYLCALAGIPERAGVSDEFGGQALTHWVRPGQADSAFTLPYDLCTTHDCATQERS
ncbi:hypothetical protein [Deinococcus aluminii]|uniref:Glycosyltransferase family 9 protein n=1 Tax=Deinococcus aluminii TaxID=1656885 RepID=A0ABP9XFY9_9DEIO